MREMVSPSHRAISVDGLVNARDLGGLRRADGSTTPHGVFFRSENADWVTRAGWEQVDALGIRTVVDLDTFFEASALDESTLAAIRTWRGALA
jgi:hypothetical protein